MKRPLCALVFLTAGPGAALADLSLSGSAYMGIGSFDGGATWRPLARVTLSLGFSGETDGGLGFGVDLDLPAPANNALPGGGYFGTAGGLPDATGLWLSGDFGTFSLDLAR